jgi:NAD(P)-dependent dehydrogenase (short-subunit alcohol dehydrogenase family)
VPPSTPRFGLARDGAVLDAAAMTQTAFITGGASGIGLRLAELLAERGADLAIVDRQITPAATERLRGALGSDRRLELVEVDVRDAGAVAAGIDGAVAAIGAPQLVINSAGVQLGKPFTGLTEDEFRRVVEINLFGSRNVAAAVLPHLQAGGHLVLVASLAGLVPNYGYAAYCASKYGVVGLAEVLRLECRPAGIRVSCVCPPEVETPMVAEERLTQLAPTEELKRLAGTMELDPAAGQILAGIDRGDFLIIPSIRARGARYAARFLPSRVAHAVSDRVVARALRSGAGG